MIYGWPHWMDCIGPEDDNDGYYDYLIETESISEMLMDVERHDDYHVHLQGDDPGHSSADARTD